MLSSEFSLAVWVLLLIGAGSFYVLTRRTDPAPAPRMPFMVSALLLIGAWATCLSMAFLGRNLNMVFCGGGFLLAAFLFLYLSERGCGGAFVRQLALACSLIGKIQFVWGLYNWWHLQPVAVFALTAVVAALSYPVFRQGADRAFCVAAAAWLGLVWLKADYHWPWVYLETAAVTLFAIAYGLFNASNPNHQPLAWGLLAACAEPVLLAGNPQIVFGGWNPLLLGVIMGGFYGYFMRRKINGFILMLIVVLAAVSNTGTVMGAGLLVLGLAQKRRVLQIVGVGVFAMSLVFLYYYMQVTLLVKAYYLCGTGAALLLVSRWLKIGGNYAR